MIDQLSLSLKAMLVGEAVAGSELAKATLNFGAPTAEWLRAQSGLVLNVYLFRLQEDRGRRSNERTLTRKLDGTSTLTLTPPRLECAYVITAWNLAQSLGTEDREQQEHRLLAQALLVLWRNTTLPSRYLTAQLTATQPIELPVIAAESNELGSADSDFWSSLGTHLRPSVTCKVTLSLDLKQDIEGIMVTTVRTTVGDDVAHLVGGSVSDGTAPIADAWVRLDESARVFITDAEGRFVIDRLQPGPHTLTVRAVGYHDTTRTIRVPDGEYGVTLTPI
ncbi:hypothetical protein BH09MYX1_BH09MYX1_58850 [soil metagenome]